MSVAVPLHEIRAEFAELDDPVDVVLFEWPQDDAFSAQFHDDLVTPAATTLSR